MIQIRKIMILGYYDLDDREKGFIKELLTCISYNDFILKTDINEKIAQIAIIKNKLYLYYSLTPSENDIKLIEDIKEFLLVNYSHDFMREIIHLNVNKINFEINDN